MTLIVDTTAPPLRSVVVYGTLEFQDTMDHVFQAEAILIQVSMNARVIIITVCVKKNNVIKQQAIKKEINKNTNKMNLFILPRKWIKVNLLVFLILTSPRAVL